MDFDSPWKDALEVYFEPCMAMFFPEIHRGVNWSHKPEFLDKEFQKITKQSTDKRRYVDKLVKVLLHGGKELRILIHIEVQNQRDSDFTERMYIYNYRIFDRHKQDVISLGIMGDSDASYRPDQYRRKRFGCNLLFTFPIIKLLDYAQDWDKLQQSKNPFAVVVMAHLKAQEVQDVQARKQWKLTLIKQLFQSGRDRRDIENLLAFIDWLLDLPEELEQELLNELSKIEEEQQMKYITSWERIGEKRGERRGEKQGKTKFFTRLLENRFGTLPEWTRSKCQQATPEMLEQWGIRLFSANSIEEVFGKTTPDEN
jgi:hypothetical protein